MSLVQNCAVGHGVVIPSGQAMFKPGLDGLSYGVGAVFGGKAVTLVSTQREQLLLRLCLGLSGHPLPLPLACGAESDIDGRHPPLPRFVPVKRALAAAPACGHWSEPSLLSREDRHTPSSMKSRTSLMSRQIRHRSRHFRRRRYRDRRRRWTGRHLRGRPQEVHAPVSRNFSAPARLVIPSGQMPARPLCPEFS